MKAVLVLLLLIVSMTFAYIPLRSENGDEVISELKKKNNGVIVILFVSEAELGTELDQINDDFEYHLTSKILYNHPSIKYAKIDVNNPVYSNLVEICGIIKKDLYDSPSVLISENQKGEWVHGDRTLARISAFLK